MKLTKRRNIHRQEPFVTASIKRVTTALLPLLAFSCGLPLALRLRHLAQLALAH